MKANEEEKSIMSVTGKLSKMLLASSEVIKLFKTATTSNERFFFSPALKWSEDLRPTMGMGNDRLCHLMLIAVEGTAVKSLDPDKLVRDSF